MLSGTNSRRQSLCSGHALRIMATRLPEIFMRHFKCFGMGIQNANDKQL